MLGDAFFDSDIALFGATALVPQLHDGLSGLLRRARASGAVTVVGTVYDFRNEQRHPERPWPLGDSRVSFPLIDLLVCDREEALRISGCDDVSAAIATFLEGGIGSVVVTHGAQCIHLASGGGVFKAQPLTTLPVSGAINDALAAGDGTGGDTTGCGDNFLGGALTSLARQMLDGRRQGLDLVDASAWGVASGGYACFYPGGTFIEPAPGHKREHIAAYHAAYLTQIGVAG